MSPDELRAEHGRAEDALLESDAQLRSLMGLIDAAKSPEGNISPTDCAKLVDAALALNKSLREREDRLKSLVALAAVRKSAP